MRIGVFHPSLDMYGGAEVVAIATVNALARNGHKVVLFVNNEVNQKRVKQMMGEPLSSSNVVVSHNILKPRGIFHLYESLLRSLAFKAQCDILIDTYSCFVFPWIDISYVHFPYLNNYDYNSNFPYVKKPSFQHLLTTPYAAFEKNLEKYDGKLLLANSYFTAKAIKASLGADSEVIYPPIPNAFFEGNRVNLELPRNNLVVTVARFGPGKGVELVPEIAYRTSKHIKFVIVGLAHDLSIVEEVRRRIRRLNLEDRVTIITNASREQIICLLSQAKIYLHTMKMEHFGISIAEGMAMGCLPVVHDSGGAPEFVPSQYRYKNFNDAAVILDKTIFQWEPQAAQKMMKIAEKFSEKNYSRRFVDLFKEYVVCQKRFN